MSETVNYGLYLTDSSSEKFQVWREKMNGKSDSNMIKIDTVLGEKADSSVSVETTLRVDGWTGNTQKISVTGLGATQNGIIGISQSANAAQKYEAKCANLVVDGQSENEITVVAEGNLPKLDIPVCVIVLG